MFNHFVGYGIFLATYSDWSLLILRIAFGAIMLAHGIPKLRDIKGTTAMFNQMGFKPGALFGGISAFLETLGGLTIIFGFLTQPFALLFVIEFLTIIIWKIATKKPFKGQYGWEFDLIILGAAILLLSIGAGAYSADTSIFWGGV